MEANWNIAGHDWAVHLLQGHLTRGQLRHAYLFTGPPGVGRRTLALRLAQAINCLQPPAPGVFCGTCRACRQIEAMRHTDLSVVQCDPDTGSIKVEHIRELLHTLTLAPYESAYRIALIPRFQDATASAQNALLKSLEEAPQRVVLLLTADSSESLLPTIVSRCEVLRLRPMPLEVLKSELQTRGLGAEDARLLAHLSGGRLGYALRLISQPELLDTRRSLIEDMLVMLGSPVRDRFALAEKISKDREALREAYQVWLSVWRDLMLRSASSRLPLVNLDMEAEINHLAGMVDFITARARVADLEQSITRLDANLNARLLTEVLLLDWPRLALDYGEAE